MAKAGTGGQVVHIEGLRECIRAFDEIDRALGREFRRELRRVAEPLREEVRKELDAKSASAQTRSGVSIRLRRSSEVQVEQARRKTTGMRPDWGAIQQVRDFDVAGVRMEPQVQKGLEDWIDGLADGFNRGGRL